MTTPRPMPMLESADAAEEAFYEAMQRGDVEGLMALWADDEDTVCVHPNGPRLVGLARIRESWSAILADGGIDVRPAGVRTFRAAVLAVHNLIERILVEGRGGPEVVECVATNVYVKTPDGWRLLVHHAGSSPGEEAPPSAGNATLH